MSVSHLHFALAAACMDIERASEQNLAADADATEIQAPSSLRLLMTDELCSRNLFCSGYEYIFALLLQYHSKRKESGKSHNWV